MNEAEKCKAIIRCLGGEVRKITFFNARKIAYYIKDISYGLTHWAEMEAKLLNYTPTMEEKKSGFIEIGKIFGDFATIEALADKYKKDPDEILLWEWGKVFTILWKDLEEHKIKIRNYEREKLKSK
jgi:hypothetical protein